MKTLCPECVCCLQNCLASTATRELLLAFSDLSKIVHSSYTRCSWLPSLKKSRSWSLYYLWPDQHNPELWLEQEKNACVYQAHDMQANASYLGGLAGFSMHRGLDFSRFSSSINLFTSWSCRFVFCGRPGGCNDGFSNNASMYPFGFCALKVQPGLDSLAVWPANYGQRPGIPGSNVTSLGSGMCFPRTYTHWDLLYLLLALQNER